MSSVSTFIAESSLVFLLTQCYRPVRTMIMMMMMMMMCARTISLFAEAAKRTSISQIPVYVCILHTVFELPGGRGGVNPLVDFQTPLLTCLNTGWGSVLTPPLIPWIFEFCFNYALISVL